MSEWQPLGLLITGRYRDGMGDDGGDLRVRPSILLENALEQVRDVLARHGATSPRVFGSVARGEDAEASDIDLLVAAPPGFDIFDKAELTEALEEVLGVPVDVVPDDARGPAAARAATEAVPL
jgi:predicted nucleotidyltransferase